MEKHKERVYELAICFSRIWGVVETLEPLPHADFKEVRDKMMEWAEECVTAQEQDFVEFFVKKLEREYLISPALHIPKYRKPDSQE